MKKILILFFLFMFVVGCNLSNTPSGKVEKYLNDFKNLTDDVVMDIETKVSSENLSEENKTLYKNIIVNEHENLKYEIKEESINGDNAIVVVKITVFDFHKIERESVDYMNAHPEEFSDINGMIDNNLFNTFRLNKLNNVKDTVDYEISFYLSHKDGEWILQNPDKPTIEKLNGFYNYN